MRRFFCYVKDYVSLRCNLKILNRTLGDYNEKLSHEDKRKEIEEGSSRNISLYVKGQSGY